jgi:predicted N-acetyltransferase YhbS
VALTAPALLADRHDTTAFSCGVAALDDWLRRRAMANQVSGASRTYVVCDGNKAIGYYALASGSASIDAAPGRFRRNMPQPIPVVVLARLAVDRAHQRRGIGLMLFRDAALRVLNAADTIGIRGILVHAISEEAKAFYAALGFEPSPLDPTMLMVTLDDMRKAVL